MLLCADYGAIRLKKGYQNNLCLASNGVSLAALADLLLITSHHFSSEKTLFCAEIAN